MKSVALLLLMSSAAVAQGPAGNCRSADGSMSWTSDLEGCKRANGLYKPLGADYWIAPPITLQSGTVLGAVSSSTLITNAPMPKCDDGWTLVADIGMNPMCAKELKPATR